ncbi:hypothetical protein CC78DRAFT_621077 [Lojkania enalia]|uniref:Uncharacterized protein n=1 Tax=Lojkania enalia TaxID=147567 RepID=A0A9P4MYM4_9PLEO|nr:hypothetical protein CC78DRAFT_621077 [Didymosphaeria enalia]
MATSSSTALTSESSHGSEAVGNAASQAEFVGQPYFRRLRSLEHAFPTLKGFLVKIKNADEGRKLVQNYYRIQHERSPGRCYGLQFEDDQASLIEGFPNGFGSPQALREYLEAHPAKESHEQKQRRLFILEDLEPDYVDALGDHLGVDPLVFSEQMNTWNFTDSRSIPHRGLPSISLPNQSFTLRYYEIRTLDDPSSVNQKKFQMTFAINRRRYERWRDIDLPSFSNSVDKRHAFIRRCASFWTSQEEIDCAPKGNAGKRGNDKRNDDAYQKDTDARMGHGWDAVILVDPGMAAASTGPGKDYILQDPKEYPDRARLWKADTWDQPGIVHAIEHNSWAYHDGCPTLAPLLFSQVNSRAQDRMQKFRTQRDLASPLDELVFYWVKVASSDLIKEAWKDSSNVAYYLLKYIAQHWTNQLELINCTVAKGEYFSDDYQANIDDKLSGSQWKADLVKVNDITRDINYMRRQMNHFWRAMVLNLERLGIQLGCETVDESLSQTLRGAQKDFLTINARLAPLRERVEALNTIANDLSNLRAAFKGLHDGDLSLRLSVFAAIVFPFTMVASILSMGENFLPGKKQFWIFWASSVPFVFVFAILLVYGRRPDRIFSDLKRFVKPPPGPNGIGNIKNEKVTRKANIQSSAC